MNDQITVIGMSDMHGYLIKPDDMPPGDVLCICGDVVPLDIQNDSIESIAWLCREFFSWIEALSYEKVFLIAGNHDFIFEDLSQDRNGNHRKPRRVLKKLHAPAKLVLLEDTEVLYKGFRFYGSPWCPDLSRWAFYKDSKGLTETFEKIPMKVDVLLTHCPPNIDRYGTVLQQGYNYLANYGCDELARAVQDKAPRLHIFGHVHSGSHLRQTIGGTELANVSIKDEGYVHSYNPQSFILKKQ